MTARSLKQIEQWNKACAKGTRIHRLKHFGKTHPLTKQEARILCEQAAASHPITKLPAAPPTKEC
jgi:hypothetical protein